MEQPSSMLMCTLETPHPTVPLNDAGAGSLDVLVAGLADLKLQHTGFQGGVSGATRGLIRAPRSHLWFHLPRHRHESASRCKHACRNHHHWLLCPHLLQHSPVGHLVPPPLLAHFLFEETLGGEEEGVGAGGGAQRYAAVNWTVCRNV
jgi:hypothetical protein